MRRDSETVTVLNCTLSQTENSFNNSTLSRFGLRVVGIGQTFPAAKVLWLLPQGAAQRAGIRVGDRVGTMWSEYYVVLRTEDGVLMF